MTAIVNGSSPTNDRALRLREVISRVGMSRTWIYDRVAEGEFPAPVKIGQRASAWLESEVNEWLRERAAQRDRSGTAA